MEPAAVGPMVSSLISGIFGAGAASWFIKQIITRSFSKIDNIESSVNTLKTNFAVLDNNVTSIKDSIASLTVVQAEQRKLEKKMIETTHKIERCEESTKRNFEQLSSLKQEFVNLQRVLDKIASPTN